MEYTDLQTMVAASSNHKEFLHIKTGDKVSKEAMEFVQAIVPSNGELEIKFEDGETLKFNKSISARCVAGIEVISGDAFLYLPENNSQILIGQ